MAMPAPALTDVVTPPTGTRILPSGPSALGPYTPPTTLSTAIDLFRRMTAPVFINGQGPFPFVVDTGANESVISLELAAQLNLPKGPPQPLHSIVDVQMAETVTAAEMRVGDRAMTNLRMSALPADGIGGPGLLGLDRLSDQRLTLNFSDRRLLLQASKKARSDPDDIVLAARRRSGQLTLIDAKVMDETVTAFLDTGAEVSCGNLKLKTFIQSRIPPDHWRPAAIISVTGQTLEGESATLSSMHVGVLNINHLNVVFADLHTFHIWNMVDVPAMVLGIDVLCQFQQVALDFPRNEVLLQLPDKPLLRIG